MSIIRPPRRHKGASKKRNYSPPGKGGGYRETLPNTSLNQIAGPSHQHGSKITDLIAKKHSE